LNADLVLVQEAQLPTAPADLGYHVVTDRTPAWGASIIIRGDRTYRPITFDADTVLGRSVKYIAAAWVDVNDVETLVASVHATTGGAKPGVTDGIELGPSEFSSLQPGGKMHTQELAVLELSRLAGTAPLVVGGDWNTSRRYDAAYGDTHWHDRFCERLQARGWIETFDWLHRNDNPRPQEPQTYFGRKLPIQDDHVFVSPALAEHLTECFAIPEFAIDELSDHAPLVVQLSFD
jgi:hypothetical protein